MGQNCLGELEAHLDSECTQKWTSNKESITVDRNLCCQEDTLQVPDFSLPSAGGSAHTSNNTMHNSNYVGFLCIPVNHTHQGHPDQQSSHKRSVKIEISTAKCLALKANLCLPPKKSRAHCKMGNLKGRSHDVDNNHVMSKRLQIRV